MESLYNLMSTVSEINHHPPPFTPSFIITITITITITTSSSTTGVGELAHMTGPSAFLQCSHFDRGILSTIRQHLKKHHYTDFSALLDAAQQEAGWKKEEVRELFFQFHVPLEPEMLELLLGWCTDVEGHVAVDEMIALLNWQEEISTELDNHMRDLVGGRGGGGAITRDTRMVVLDHSYKTSAQTHSSSTGRIQTASKLYIMHTSTYLHMVTHIHMVVHCTDYRSFGVPTIRSDRPAPTIRRVGDNIVSCTHTHTHVRMHARARTLIFSLPDHRIMVMRVMHMG